MMMWGVPFHQSFASENGHCLVKMFSMFSHFIDVKICFIWVRNRSLLTSIQQYFMHKPAFVSGSLVVTACKVVCLEVVFRCNSIVNVDILFWLAYVFSYVCAKVSTSLTDASGLADSASVLVYLSQSVLLNNLRPVYIEVGEPKKVGRPAWVG